MWCLLRRGLLLLLLRLYLLQPLQILLRARSTIV
jgi:hypothetical protein